jgi:hypothetical protein
MATIACKKGTKEQTNLLLQPVITAEQVDTAGKTQHILCLNILAGNVSPEIITANSVRGRLGKLLPNMAQADLSALRFVLGIKPADLRAKWETYVSARKNWRGVSLQALKKSCAEKGEQTVSLKDRLIAWMQAVSPATVEALPVKLYDILIDIMPEEKTETA